jgi:hypothetical protein
MSGGRCVGAARVGAPLRVPGSAALGQLTRADWEAERQRHFWLACEDAKRRRLQQYDLRIVDVGEYGD